MRENSRGAHYREDFPDAGDSTSTFSLVQAAGEGFAWTPAVKFTRVRPGESLLSVAPAPVRAARANRFLYG